MEQQSLSVIPQELHANLTYNQSQMLQVDSKNYVATGENKSVNERINAVLGHQLDAFLNHAFGSLYPDAVEDYKNRTDADIPFNGYGAAQNYEITYNENCYISMFADTYQFTGGAHGSTVRSSDTFSTQTGARAPVGTFLSPQNQRAVLKEIKRQAIQNMQQNPNLYFDDYLNLIQQTFVPNHFYLTPDGMVFYFQQYDIAPYAVGIVEFTIPYNQVSTPPSCK